MDVPPSPTGLDGPKGRPNLMDPVFYAVSLYRRRRFDPCVEKCTQLLERNPLDQAVWFLKTRAMIEKTYVDDVMDMEDEGVAELLMDQNAIAQLPRPGTSLARPLTSASGSQSQIVRPVSASGRPLSGYARPGTGSSRPATGSMTVDQAFQGNRPGTSRPVTSSGRFVRLGTASMVSDPGGVYINIDKLDLRKYAARPALAKMLCDYMLYQLQNPRKALELASLATAQSDFKDWWWKARLGKCYYKLGLLREAERQFKSSLKNQEMVSTYLELCKVYLKMDQPNTALEYYLKGSERFPGDVSLLTGVARVYDAINDIPKSILYYKKVLQVDNANVEAIACIASNHFYTDQPELALRFYRRLLQMGVNSTEIWANIGLCCFYAQQFDMSLNCFERALILANDSDMGDVWYNFGHVAIGIGDVNLAYQAFKIAVSIDPHHAESFNNLGVLELRRGNIEQAKSNFQSALTLNQHLHEAFFNAALLANKVGDLQESFKYASKALEICPTHTESHELMKQLRVHFSTL